VRDLSARAMQRHTDGVGQFLFVHAALSQDVVQNRCVVGVSPREQHHRWPVQQYLEVACLSRVTRE
jgi:hypothetical protein